MSTDERRNRVAEIPKGRAMKEFRCRLFDKRYGGEIGHVGGETIEAESRTDARKTLAKEWKRDTPREARAHGFVPWRDVRIVWDC